jgi:cobalt-precorrin 5A hydrolase
MDSEKGATQPEDRTAIVAVTLGGASLALRLQSKLPGSDCYVPERHRFAVAMGAFGYERLGALFPRIWSRYRSLICIMATGIVVRLIAPLLRHKTLDPAVVVLDERGSYAISLVSGHLGGANRLAEKVARIIGGQAVITTASDVCGRPAWDMIAAEAGLEIENVEMLAPLTRALIEDEPIWIFDPQDRLGAYLADQANVFSLTSERMRGILDRESRLPDDRVFSRRLSEQDRGDGGAIPPDREAHVPDKIPGSLKSDSHGDNDDDSISMGRSVSEDLFSGAGVWVSELAAPATFRCLILRPHNLVVGVGCNRGTPVREVVDFLKTVFDQEGLALLSIRNLASVDLKADEAAILEAAREIDRPVHFYSRNDLKNIAVPNPSGVVSAHIGVPSVCEATALLSAGTETLLIPKQKTANVTLAVARADSP